MSSNHRLGLSTLHFLLKELRTEVSLGKRRKCCPSTLLQRNLNWNATIPNYFQLDLCLRKTRAGKSRVTQAALAIVSKKSVFKMFFFHTKTRQRSSNSADLKSVLEKATFPWREWNFRASQRMRGLSSLNYCLSACFRVLVRQVQPIPTNHAGANKNILTAKCVFLNNFVLSYSPTNVVNMFHCLVSNREGLGTSL